MNIINMLGWIGNAGFIIGSYLIAKRKIVGFYFFSVANSLYIIIGFMSKIPSLWAISCYLVIMNVYGIITWKKNITITKGISNMKKENLISHKAVMRSFKEEAKRRKRYPILYLIRDSYYSIKNYIVMLPLNIKTFIQRGKRGYADSDVWGLDYYLSDVIEHAVRKLKRDSYSGPEGLTEGQWIDILNEISYAFHLSKRISSNDLFLIRNKKQREDWNRTLEKINKKHNRNDRCLTPHEIKAFDKGWELFKQYFHNLWD